MVVSVYSITNITNGRQYIGITARAPKRRWQGHLRDALIKHTKTAIGSALRKYGKGCFRFEVMYEAIDRQEANAVERAFIVAYGTLAPKGYNLTTGGDFAPTRTGAVTPPETRAKMSAASLGRKKSPEHVESMRRAMVGRTISPDHLAALVRGRRAKTSPLSPLHALAARIRRREEALRRNGANVELCNGTGPWRARISMDGKTVHLGLFDHEADARAAWLVAAEAHLARMRAELAKMAEAQ